MITDLNSTELSVLLIYYSKFCSSGRRTISGTVLVLPEEGEALGTVLDLPEMGDLSRTVFVLSQKSGRSEFKFTGDPGAVSAPAIITWGGFSARKPDPILNMNMKYKPT